MAHEANAIANVNASLGESSASVDSSTQRPQCSLSRTKGPGNATCPCSRLLGPYGIPMGIDISVGVDGVVYQYPQTYGTGGCAAHDALLPPYCKVVLSDSSRVNVDLEKWCFLPWCYVIVRGWNAGRS